MMTEHPPEPPKAPPGDALIFDWKTHRTPRFAKIGMLTVAVSVFILPLAMIRITVGTPPVQEAHSASMMMVAPQNDPMRWLDAARNLGPFPSRFEPQEWQQSTALVEEVLSSVGNRSLTPHRPQYQDLPEETLPPVPLVAKGTRVLPHVAPPEFKLLEAKSISPVPMLYPLSVSVEELPTTHPPFEAEVTPEMAFQPWRFLLQVAPDGRVVYAFALIGHNTPGRTDLTRWLKAHRFSPLDQPADRWVAVAVTFQNPTPDGTLDP